VAKGKEVAPPKKLRLSASRVSIYLHCPKQYWWTYHEQLKVKSVSLPLAVGGITHRLLHQMHVGKLPIERMKDYDEVVMKHYPHLTSQEAKEVAVQAMTLFAGYAQKYEQDPLEVVSSEMHLESDRGLYILYARVDGLVRTQDQRLWRFETKTTSRIDSAYLSGLKGGIQGGIAHALLKEAVPERVYGTIYNLIVKTKVPQFERSPVLAEKSLEAMTEGMLRGVYEGIVNARFYPSMQCFFYNRQCDFLPLCKNDSPQMRESFYEHREEVIPQNEEEEED